MVSGSSGRVDPVVKEQVFMAAYCSFGVTWQIYRNECLHTAIYIGLQDIQGQNGKKWHKLTQRYLNGIAEPIHFGWFQTGANLGLALLRIILVGKVHRGHGVG